MNCFGCFKEQRYPCYKFMVAVIISFSAMAFAISMLSVDRFQNQALTSFCCSIFSSVLAFWMDAPNMFQKKKMKIEDKKQTIDI